MNLYKAYQIINESLLFSKSPIIIDLDKFESGEKNILFVTGFRGSGKTHTAKDLASKYKCDLILLDKLDEEASREIYNLKPNESIPKEIDNFSPNRLKIMKRVQDKLQKILETKYKNKRVVIEGLDIHIFYAIDIWNNNKSYWVQIINNNPIIILRKSAIKSGYDAYNRNKSKRNPEKSISKEELKAYYKNTKFPIVENKYLNVLIKERQK